MNLKTLEGFNKFFSTDQSLEFLMKKYLFDDSIDVVFKGEDPNRDYDYIVRYDHFVDSLGGAKIIINSNEHPPPHFHIIYGEFNASFRIDTGEKMKGDMPKKVIRKLKIWHKCNGKEVLINKWNETRIEGCSVGPYRN